MSLAYIAFGANLGDRFQAWMFALTNLHQTEDCQIVGYSPLYETEPMGGPEQPMYLNAVVVLQTDQSPTALLTLLQSLEHQYGRTRDVHWGPRTLDLDLLLYDDLVLETADEAHLVLPHPQMHLRRFVLQPLSDVAPDLKHPVLGERMSKLLYACSDTTSMIPYRELSRNSGHEPKETPS